MNEYLNSLPLALDRLKFASNIRVGESTLRSMEIEQYQDHILGQLMFSLQAEVLAEKLVSENVTATKVIQQPLHWWDHLKRDVWYTDLTHDRIMRWVERRWPVRYKDVEVMVTVRFERYAKFPHATIRVPELGTPVIFEQWREPRWRVGDV